MSGETAEQIGFDVGNRFRLSVESQLRNIAAQAGVSVASLSTGDYGSSSTSGSARGMGTGGGRGGRRGTRSTGDGGGTHHAAEQPYKGEPVLGETAALATPTAKDPGAAKESDVSAATRNPGNAAKMSAAEAATRDPNNAQAARAAAVASGRQPEHGSADTDAAIQEAAKAAGVDVNTMRSIASIESSMTPGSNRNRATQYKGLYQIGHAEWKQFGSGDIYNAHDNAMAAARMFASHREEFRNHFGREPTDKELYMIHQQGLGFFTRNAMTNIGGNRYPGMHGPQTHDSFMEGWGREVARRKAWYSGGEGQTTDSATAAPQQRDGAPSPATVHVGPVTSAAPGPKDENGRAVDPDTLNGVMSIAKTGDAAVMKKYLASRGFNLGATACGEIATRMAGKAGLQGAGPVASNWLKFGTQEDPSAINAPGHPLGSTVAVSPTATYGPRRGLPLPPGQTGGHVKQVIPGSYDPKTGKADFIDQSGVHRQPIGNYQIRHQDLPPEQPAPVAAGRPQMPLSDAREQPTANLSPAAVSPEYARPSEGQQAGGDVGDFNELAQKNTNVLRPGAGRNSANKTLPDALKEHPGVGRTEGESQDTGKFLDLKGKVEARDPTMQKDSTDKGWEDKVQEKKKETKA